MALGDISARAAEMRPIRDSELALALRYVIRLGLDGMRRRLSIQGRTSAREIEQLRANLVCAEETAEVRAAEVIAFRAAVDNANSRIEELELAAARERLPDPLYRRVGLLGPSTPWFVVQAAEKAYRVALHEDRHPLHRVAARQRWFEVERIFNAIADQRRARV